MENKPQLNKPTVLQQNNTPTEINLPGDHNTLIAHADNVKNEYRPTILITNPYAGVCSKVTRYPLNTKPRFL